MLLLVLVLIALAAGCAASFATRHPLRRMAAAPPSLQIARGLGEHAGHHRRLRRILATRMAPEKATGLALTLALILIVVGGLVLGALTVAVRSSDGLIAVDSGVADWADRHASAASTDGVTLVTRLGETWLVVAVGALIAWIDHRRTTSLWAAPFLLTAVAGDKLLVGMTKDLVDRVRPTLNPIAETLGPSFPSGHTSTAAVFWAAAALVAGRWCGPRGRAVLAGLAVGIAVGVAASRVLLDVHWLTDVIAGLALGWAWFAACAIAFGGRLLRFAAATAFAEYVATHTPDDDDPDPDRRGDRVASLAAAPGRSVRCGVAHVAPRLRAVCPAGRCRDTLVPVRPSQHSTRRDTMTDVAIQPQTPAVEVEDWLSRFDAALSAGDTAAAAAMFADESYWRDLIAFTWNIKTVEHPEGVKKMLDHTLAATGPSGWHLTEPPAAADGVTDAWIAFETAVGRGIGHLRLKDGKAFTLLTALQELKGHEEPRGPQRPRGAEHGADRNGGRKSWLEQRALEAETLGHTTQPEVVLVGGGQGGIALGARLRQLGVPTIIVERNARPGDSWRKRYKSLCLHDPVWYDHLPYIKFPENWPVFSPKDKIADWLEMYTKVMELNYWSSTTAKSARYDEAAGEWIVVVEREGADITLHPKQLVMATGMSGKPNVPEIPGMEVFRGDQHHSSQHPGPDAYRGKRAVVIGSNNSAHDICAALWDVGADVTMVQRSSTHIVRSDTLMDIGLGALYSEEAVASGVTTEKADLIFASLPYRILHEFQIPLYDQMRERDADFYARLEAAGFELDFGDDGSGLFMKYLRRGSGYYIDVGASDLVADGEIKLAHGQVARLTQDAVILEDGTELPAELVVYATGYGSMNGWVADLISPEVADKVGKVWGLGSDTTKDPGPWEGEQRNMWKPTAQEALWFHGGNLHQSRFYSLYLALQLKARAEGIDTSVYGRGAVHHLR